MNLTDSASRARTRPLPWLMLLIALIVGMESYTGTMLGRLGLALHDSAHGPFFFVVALIVERVFSGVGCYLAARIRRRLVLLTLSLGFLCVATEAVQLWTPRDASLTDVGTNLLGAAAGISWLLASGRLSGSGHGLSRRGVIWGRILATLLLAWSVGPAITAIAAHTSRARQAPVIFAPARPFSRYFLSAMGSQVELVQGDGGEALARVRFLDKNWPALAIDPIPDWRGHSNLTLEVSLPEVSELELHLRIDDALHNQEYSDRFNATFVLSPGNNRLSIPLADIKAAPASREMDLSRVKRIVIFARREDKGRVIELRRVSLE